MGTSLPTITSWSSSEAHAQKNDRIPPFDFNTIDDKLFEFENIKKALTNV